jgi:hypothetical protein
MTTDELELERDLKTLAEPRAGDERLHDAIRATLGEQLETQPRSRRRTRLAFGAAAVAAATAAAATVALLGTGGSGGPSSADAAILAHVTHTISPPANLIVHVKETGVQPDGTPVAVEWWQETNAPYALRLIKGRAGQPVEGASDGTNSFQYDAGTNTIYEHPNSGPPTLVDPIESVRAALADGTAQVAGTVTIDGRSLYKVELSNGVVGYFDRTTYRPVYLDNPQGDGSVVRTQVVAYEELALNPENEKLLSIAAQHPGASVETGPSPEPAKQK